MIPTHSSTTACTHQGSCSAFFAHYFIKSVKKKRNNYFSFHSSHFLIMKSSMKNVEQMNELMNV